MSESKPDWDEIGRRYPPNLVSAVRSLFSKQERFSITATALAITAAAGEDDATSLLVQLCPPLEEEALLSCPCCSLAITEEEASHDTCSSCGNVFAEHGGVKIAKIFAYHSRRSRDVAWAIAIHGMNTRGAWQEQLNWRVSTTYSRSVPVAIYKYGIVRPGALWKPALLKKMRRIAAKVAVLQGDSERGGFVGRPDVIAHSLGTWLIGHALRDDASLVVGRVILTGSILRPDFDWKALINRGQVEAVLNHYGTKDFWAAIAHFVIPDSGPSGRRGFNPDVPVQQVRAEGFGHSDFFLDKNLPDVFEKIWRPFLSNPNICSLPTAACEEMWRPAPWLLRATALRIFLLFTFWGLLALASTCLIVGAYELFSWILST